MYEEKVIKRRISNRTYPPRYCVKPDCNNEFIPNDARQKYCCEQHRIDANNDKRRIINEIEAGFTKRAKNNERILIKICSSPLYLKYKCINHWILEHEGYDFETFHYLEFDVETGFEIQFCYKHGILLIDAEKKYFKVIIKE
jgi:hypothetical protein